MTKSRGGLATPQPNPTPTSNPYEILSSDFPHGPAPKKRFIRDNLTSSTNTGRFLIVTHADPEQSLNKINPFIVMKALEGYTRDLKEVTRLRNGTLLIETQNQQQANILYKATSLGTTPIVIKDHPTLNTVRGTVFSYDLIDLDEEYLLQNLKDQKISKVERVKKFNESRELVPTPLLILTFESKTVPISIKAGFLLLRTRKYYPLPLKCKTCHKFGHTAKRCRGQRLCVSCGELNHENDCTDIKCVNCCKFYPSFSTSHRANDRNCLKYLEEKEIVRIMVDENKMYNDARAKFNQLYPKTTTTSTFAATVQINSTTNTNNNKRSKPTTSIEPNAAQQSSSSYAHPSPNHQEPLQVPKTLPHQQNFKSNTTNNQMITPSSSIIPSLSIKTPTLSPTLSSSLQPQSSSTSFNFSSQTINKITKSTTNSETSVNRITDTETMSTSGGIDNAIFSSNDLDYNKDGSPAFQGFGEPIE